MNVRTVLAYEELPFNEAQWKRLKQAAQPDRLVIASATDDHGIAGVLQEAEIAIITGDLDQRFIDAPMLRWVHCDLAGLTGSARPDVFSRSLIVTGSAGRSGPALAEHAIMFILVLCSDYPTFYEAQKQKQWIKHDRPASLRALWGRTIGIIGMGHTGVELARRCKAFDMRVLAYRRRDLPLPEGVDRMYCADKGEAIDQILDECDILALVVNLSDASHHLIGKRELARMKRTAFIINLSRGRVIDETALIQALYAGQIAGAGLDVAEVEPLPAASPLWEAPNTLITPHFTAAMPDKSDRALDVIVDNFSRYRSAAPMRNQMTEDDVYTR